MVMNKCNADQTHLIAKSNTHHLQNDCIAEVCK